MSVTKVKSPHEFSSPKYLVNKKGKTINKITPKAPVVSYLVVAIHSTEPVSSVIGSVPLVNGESTPHFRMSCKLCLGNTASEYLNIPEVCI